MRQRANDEKYCLISAFSLFISLNGSKECSFVEEGKNYVEKNDVSFFEWL